ncbi:Chlorophyll a-b binding protein CP26-chloroplastic [Striga hermonthica]|uniref:Chlorophyll a-b binding protein CP26-chloroplastic n=1 Tax=Striga hermonthica TaxID=68872 RepID=A0A9N7NL60_STRHE|nr:Chlorophyll a-b binding protein CP26-chloroplastic [Striga hermonthica]
MSFTVSPVLGDRKSFADRGRQAPYQMKLWATNEVRAKSKFCYWYDPFGLSKKPEDIAKYQSYELIQAIWFKTGPFLLEGCPRRSWDAATGREAAAVFLDEDG